MNPADDEIDDPIEEQASEWLVRRDTGLSRREAREFEQWKKLDSRHASAVARLEQACALLEKLPQVPGLLPPVVAFPSGAPVQAAAEKARPRARFPFARWMIGLAAALALSYGGWQQWTRKLAEPVHYATTAGGYERVLLADGSVVELNAGSEVTVLLAPRERRLTMLRGEAHFTVAHDANRPFFVSAGEVTVRAVGTAFNVRLAESGVAILVTEGRVTVARHPAAALPGPALPGEKEAKSGPEGRPPRRTWRQRAVVGADQ